MQKDKPENWKISREDRIKHNKSFYQLNPVNGMVSGEQAKGFFLKSNLSTSILAQIWDLADTNKNGRLNEHEFSIACFLIKKVLVNGSLVLPPALPVNLLFNDATSTVSAPIFISNSAFKPVEPKYVSSSFSPTSPPFLNNFCSNSPINFSSSNNGISPINLEAMSIKLQIISPNAKSKYKQIFCLNDSDASGFISCQKVRTLLVQNGLDNASITLIWHLADCDKDGKLCLEEFEIAMHLCDYFKVGNLLPTALPVELLPQSSQCSNRTIHSSSLTDSSISSSFEAKRKENFERGNYILEMKRQMLRDAEEKEKKELETKERNEEERRLRLKHELEKKHLNELRKQLDTQRATQLKQEEDRRKQDEQQRSLNDEMIRQKHIEWEIIRLAQEKLFLSVQQKSSAVGNESFRSSSSKDLGRKNSDGRV